MTERADKELSTDRKWKTATNLVLHLHPARIPEAAIRFRHTFGLGGMAALMIGLQIFTGFLLRFQYEPSVQNAYNSVQGMVETSTFGQLVRNIHYWTGQFLIIITFLHLTRVIFMGAYFPPRRANWLIGLGLFLLILLMNFTGYLLPWDQLSFWAVTVTTSMLDYIPVVGYGIKYQVLGGDHVGQNTLINFYTFHTGILPLLLVILMFYHFWKVRKNGGVILSNVPEIQNNTVPVIPNLVRKELATGLVLLAIIMFFSLFIDAPLLAKANPAVSPNPSKAPWYFLGIQELIVHIHPFFSVFLVPTILAAAFIMLAWSKKIPINPGLWFPSSQTKKIVSKTVFFSLVFIPLWIIADEYLLSFNQWLPILPFWFSKGLISFILFIVIAYVAGRQMLSNFQLPFNELVISGFVFISSSYIIMMLTSLYFRGPGMKLIFPF